jgi:hypothetical protein
VNLPDDIAVLVKSHYDDGDAEAFVRGLNAAYRRRVDEITRLTAEKEAIESLLSGAPQVDPFDRTEHVLRIIQANGGSAQIDEILEKMKEVPGLETVTKESLYHLLSGGNQSLVNRGKLARTKIGRAVIYTIGPKANVDIDIEPYLEEFRRRTRMDEHPEITRRFATSMAYYTEKILWPRNNGARVQPTRIYELLRRHGLLGTIEHLIKAVESEGYYAILATGRRDLLLETIVLDYPTLFAPEVVARSRMRLSR